MSLGLGLGLHKERARNGGGGVSFDYEYFAYNGSTVSWYGTYVGYNAIYSEVANKTFIVYEGWNGSARVVYAVEFDHATNEYSLPVQAAVSFLSNDDHGNPCLSIDSSGYLHCLYGAENSDQYWVKSASPLSIASWVQMPTKSGDFLSYPHLTAVGSTLINMGRSDISASSKKTGVLYHNTTTAWGSKVTFGDFGSDSRYYIGTVAPKDGKLHFISTMADYGDTWRRDVYYLIYDPVAGTMSNINGTYSTGTFPINKADHDAYYRIYEHDDSAALDIDKYSGGILAFCFDDAGNPNVLISNGLTTGAGYAGGGFAASIDILYLRWDGSSWTAPVVVGQCNQKYEEAAITNIGNGRLEILYTDLSETGQVRGGNIVKKTREANGVWSDPELVLNYEPPRGLDRPKPVVNARSKLRWLFLESSASQDVDGIPISDNQKAGYQRLYGYGDNGMVGTNRKHVELTLGAIPIGTANGEIITSTISRNARQSTIINCPSGKVSLVGGNIVAAKDFNTAGESVDFTLTSTLTGRDTKTDSYSMVTKYLSPSDLTGLFLWLDASDTSVNNIQQAGGLVSQWSDKSGNGNHAIQTTSSLKPVTGTATINGLNTIVSDGVDDALVLPSAIYNLPLGNNTVFCVFAKTSTSNSLARPIAGANGSFRWGVYADTANGGIGFINRPNGNYHPTDPWTNSTSPVLFVGYKNGSTLSAAVDSVGTTNSAGSEDSLTSAAVFGGSATSGKIGEIIVYNRALSGAEISRIRSYLSAKWGI